MLQLMRLNAAEYCWHGAGLDRCTIALRPRARLELRVARAPCLQPLATGFAAGRPPAPRARLVEVPTSPVHALFVAAWTP